VVPVIKRDTEIGGFTSEASGLADIRLFARYQIYRKDQPGKTLRIAPFLGAILPTGKTGETSDGSTDFFGGLILTRASTAWNFDGQLRYTANGKKNGFERGNEARIDGSVQYRMDSFNENVNVSGYLFTVLDASIVYQDENQMMGVRNFNSGGTTAFIAPGLQYRTTRWIGEAALRVPVVKNLNGTALQPGLTVITSVRFNF